MKRTISNPILFLVVLTLAKLDYVQGRGGSGGGGGGGFLGGLFEGSRENFWREFLCCRREKKFLGCKTGPNCDIRGRRHLADSGELWSSLEIEQCLEETYETALYVETGHLFLLASPEKQNSTCPTIAIDSGSSNEDDEFDLVPHISTPRRVPTGALSLNHSETLGYLSRVLSDLNHAMHTVPKNEYNVLDNNCATLLLHVFEAIALDYREPTTNSNIINYVGKSLAADKFTVDAVRKAYLEQNTGMLEQTMVGDEDMMRALVRDYMK